MSIFYHFTLFATQTDHPSPPPSLLRKWIFIFYVASLHPPCGDMVLVQSKITRGERQSILLDVGMIFTGNCLFSMKVVNIVEEPENH